MLNLRIVLVVIVTCHTIATLQVSSLHEHLQQQQQLQQQHNLDKLQKYLNERQHALIKKHPGSLMAVTRALKMAIYECQYQMRYEPWNCPIYGFSIKPSEIFGMLISRSFKETSFIQSLLSSALTHSITRACTESTIATCRRRITAQNTYSEDIDFGRHFAEQFMDATYNSPSSSSSSNYLAYDPSLNSNQIVPTKAYGKSSHQNSIIVPDQPPVWREREIRRYISAHNDEVGRLVSTVSRPTDRTNPFVCFRFCFRLSAFVSSLRISKFATSFAIVHFRSRTD